MMGVDEHDEEMMRAQPMWLEQRTRRLLEQHALGELRDERQISELERLIEAQGQTLAQAVQALQEDSTSQLLRQEQQGWPLRRAQGAPRRPRLGLGFGERLGVRTSAGPALITALAAVCLGVGVWMSQASPSAEPEREDQTQGVRAKGNAQGLLIWRLKEAGPEALLDGQLAQAGDTLQLQAHVPSGAFAAIYSVDGRGHVTQHWPYPGSGQQLEQVEGALLTVGRSYTLDDAPRFERFYLLVGDEPEALTAMERWLKDGAERAPAKLTMTIFTVRKP